MYTIEALLESVMKSIILAPLFTLTQTEHVYILLPRVLAHIQLLHTLAMDARVFFSFLISDFKP